MNALSTPAHPVSTARGQDVLPGRSVRIAEERAKSRLKSES